MEYSKQTNKQALEYVHFYIESFLERNIRGIIRALVDFI